MADNKLHVLIAGATGKLGRLITLECLKKPSLHVSILIKDIEKDKELVTMVIARGGRVFTGDVTHYNSIKGFTDGVHTVISALSGDNNVMIGGQKHLLQDALNHGVKRFVPSDFTFDFWDLKEGEHYFADQRLKFKKILDKASIGKLYFTNGIFIETFLYLNKDNFSYWGDTSLDQAIDLTAEEDVAKYVAAAVCDPNRVGHVKITGNERSFREYAMTFNWITKKNLELVKEGTVGDLIEKMFYAKKNRDFLEYVKLGYMIPLFDGRGKILHKDNNEFPDIKPISFEDFLRKNTGKFYLDYSIPKTVLKAKDDIELEIL